MGTRRLDPEPNQFQLQPNERMQLTWLLGPQFVPGSVHERVVGPVGLGSPATQLMRAVGRLLKAEQGWLAGNRRIRRGSMSAEVDTESPVSSMASKPRDLFWYWAVAAIAMMAAFAAIALWADRPGADYGWYLADFSILTPVIGCMFPAIPVAVGFTAVLGIRSRSSLRWFMAILCLFGLIISLAASYIPVAGKLIYEGVFSGSTFFQARISGKVIRLGVEPAGDFSASWYEVYECTESGVWCRNLGSVAGEANNQGQLPAKVVLQVEKNQSVSIVLDGLRVAYYQAGALVCVPSEIERCH